MVEFINRTIGTMTVEDRRTLERLLEELAANTSRALLTDAPGQTDAATPADDGESLA